MLVNASEIGFFKLLAARQADAPIVALSQKSIQEFRAGVEFFSEFTGVAANIPVQEASILTRDGVQLPIRIYNHQLPEETPVLFFYPGNGYAVDLFEINAIAASRIAQYAAAKVIVVNSRLSPEFLLPLPILDAYDATLYVVLNADLFHIDPDKIVVGGICSGAHCAAVISHMACREKDFKIQHQILLNGYYDLSHTCLDYASYEQEDKMLTREVLAYLSEKSGVTAASAQTPLLSPYFETELTGLPVTTIIIAEYDGVRGDSEAYYQKLLAANIPVNRILLKGQTHNTLLLRAAMHQGEDPAAAIARVLHEHCF